VARGYDPLADDQVQAAIDAFHAAEASPPSTQLPGWALATDVATALAAKADAAALATKVNSSTYTAGLAGKADQVGGKVPEGQPPLRMCGFYATGKRRPTGAASRQRASPASTKPGDIVGRGGQHDLVTVTEIVGLVLLVCAGVAFLAARVARAREAKRPRVPVEEARAEVLSIATRGDDSDRIRAIRVLRERTGLGLLEARDTLMRWLDEDSAGRSE
jgi:hypothetical protein